MANDEDDDGKESYVLMNIASGSISGASRTRMKPEEVRSRNEWLEIYGSPNIRWVTDEEADIILKSLL